VSHNLTISAGMPRAGSGWYYNLVHDLIIASGGQNAREIRQKYYLHFFLTAVNCNISTLKIFRLLPVFIPVLLGNRFAVKTHAGPTRFSEWLNRNERLSTIYIYRDPRAALLSAYEYGQKAIRQNRQNPFSQIKTLEEAGDFMQFYVGIWRTWSKTKNVLLVRYEDLIEDYPVEFNRLVEHLHLEIAHAQSERVFEQYRPEKGESGQIGTHFSIGEAERFRSELNTSQLERFTAMFLEDFSRMGYKP
jgi:hypothetical protein